MRHGAVAVAELAVVVALEAGVGVMVGYRKCIDQRIGGLYTRAQKLVKPVAVYALAAYRTPKTPQTAAGKFKFAYVDHAAPVRQRSSKVGYHIGKVLVVASAVRYDDNLFTIAL